MDSNNDSGVKKKTILDILERDIKRVADLERKYPEARKQLDRLKQLKRELE